MKNRILKQIIIDSSIAATLLILLSGWGFTGHQKITSQAGNMLNQKIEGFDKLTPFIVEHSTDPDFRKSWVRTEFPKHFIDIDNYPEFTSSGNITSNYDSLKAKHGEEFIIEQGTLPWATKIAFDSLLQCFKRNDFPGTGFWAANLSHYVGDGHMPLHTTRNYDGEETGNKGIHVRYESKMISVFADSLLSRPKQINYIENTDSLIFNYIYQSNLVSQLLSMQCKLNSQEFQMPVQIDCWLRQKYFSIVQINTPESHGASSVSYTHLRRRRWATISLIPRT